MVLEEAQCENNNPATTLGLFEDQNNGGGLALPQDSLAALARPGATKRAPP